jgi:pyruvate, orthophosphate dikinase
MKGLPVTIRLLDPPLHEFLPHDEKSQEELAKQPRREALEKVKAARRQLHEPTRCSATAAAA